jgi:hypothetical protein
MLKELKPVQCLNNTNPGHTKGSTGIITGDGILSD